MRLLEVVSSSLKNDQYDLLYEFSDEEIGKLYSNKDNIPQKGKLKRILSYFVQLIECFKNAEGDTANYESDSIVFFVNSRNEYLSLQPLINLNKKNIIVGRNLPSIDNFPFRMSYLLGVLYLPIVFFKFFSGNKYKKESYSYALDQYLLVYGVYLVSRYWLKSFNPKAIVFANHSNPIARTIHRAATHGKIKTIFFQHSTLNKAQPKLDFNYIFLHGEADLRKIKYTKSKIFLTGSQKLDQHINKVKQNINIGTIGVCINGVDPTERIVELLLLTIELFPEYIIKIRPHPSDKRANDFRRLAEEYLIEFSDPCSEDAIDYIKEVDVLIAGDSSILLEAIYFNTIPLFYDFENNHCDRYSYIENKMVNYTNSVGGLIDNLKYEILNHEKSVRYKAKDYLITIDTKWEGEIVHLLQLTLQSLIYKDGDNCSLWNKKKVNGLVVYEPS